MDHTQTHTNTRQRKAWTAANRSTHHHVCHAQERCSRVDDTHHVLYTGNARGIGHVACIQHTGNRVFACVCGCVCARMRQRVLRQTCVRLCAQMLAIVVCAEAGNVCVCVCALKLIRRTCMCLCLALHSSGLQRSLALLCARTCRYCVYDCMCVCVCV